MSYDDYDPDDRDAPQPSDLDRPDTGDETIPCPNCGRHLHEDSEFCPSCGEWILDDSPASRRSRGWFWPLVVGFLVAAILVLWHGLR